MLSYIAQATGRGNIPPETAQLVRHQIAVALAVAAAVGSNMYFSIELTRHASEIAAVWTANGLLLAALLLTPDAKLRLMQIVMCAAANFVVNIVQDRPIGINLVFTAANTIEVMSAFWVYTRLCAQPLELSKIAALKSFSFACGSAPVLTAILVAIFTSIASQANFWNTLFDWYVSDVLGLLIVTPAVVLMIREGSEILRLQNRLQIIVLFAFLLTVTFVVFSLNYPLLFLIYPALILIAYKLGPAPTALATIIVAAIALTHPFMGPFASNMANASEHARIILAQVFVLVVFYTSLPLAEVMAEERRLRDRLTAEVQLSAGLAEGFRNQQQALVDQKIESEAVHTRLSDALDVMPAGVVMLDSKGNYVTWNKKYEDIYKETADQLFVGGSIETATRIGLKRGIYPGAVGQEEKWLAERLERLRNPGEPHEQVLADGRHFLIKECRTSDGGIISVRSDITELKRKEASSRLLFESNPLPMFVVCQSTLSILAVNKAAIGDYGYLEQEFLQMSFNEIQRGFTRNTESKQNNGANGDGKPTQHVKRSGAVIDVEIHITEFEHLGVPSIMIAAIDMTLRNKAEAKAAHMARHDPLTNLPNRNMLAERMSQAVARVRRGDRVALLLLDLDNFKSINDTLGHAAGDELLNGVADRLRYVVREVDTVARLGGDEFAVLLIGADLPRGAAVVAERIIDCIAQPFFLGTTQVSCSVSVGIAIAPNDAVEAADLFRFADLALYTAKDEKRGTYRFFQDDMNEKVHLRALLEADLKTALENDELEIHYQPIVSVELGRPICAEALVRWRHPIRGLIPPMEFVPIAEETGLIVKLGELVMRRACKDAAQWPDSMAVAVNLSAIELSNPSLISIVRSSLAEAGLPGERLHIEVTETTVMKDVEKSVATLKAIGKLGVDISMDDFGTGYSSLSSLRSFPFNKIKIDRSFVMDLETSQEAREVLATILALAKTLGMRSTAEGVETNEQLRIVQSLGCTEVQGYLYSKPLPLAQLQLFLAGCDVDTRNAA